MTDTIAISVSVRLPQQYESRLVHCPAGLYAAAFLRMVCGDRWKSDNVLLVSEGRVVLADDVLHDGMALEILPMVDGG